MGEQVTTERLHATSSPAVGLHKGETMKYKLRIKSTWYVSAKKWQSATAIFVWEDKADALACKELLAKARRIENSRFKTDVEFVAFTEEEAL